MTESLDRRVRDRISDAKRLARPGTGEENDE